jgi:hypothetical protein
VLLNVDYVAATQSSKLTVIRARSGMDKIYKILALVMTAGLFLGCSSITNVNRTADSTVEGQGLENDPDSNPTDDSPYARSPRRQIGYGFSIEFFGGDKDKKDDGDASEIAIDDPEYAEYLEWKRWQEFKAYQEWKAQQMGAESAS